MSESSSGTGSALSNALVLFLAALVVAAVLITFGGRSRSLALIGVGTLVFCAALIWAETSTQTNPGVVVTLLPWILALYLITAGLYLDNDWLWWAGFVLLIGDVVWRSRSEFRRLISRFQEGNYE